MPILDMEIISQANIAATNQADMATSIQVGTATNQVVTLAGHTVNLEAIPALVAAGTPIPTVPAVDPA